MQRHNIILTKEESGYIHYTSYKLKSIQNLIDMFLINKYQFEYSKDQMEILVDKYCDLSVELNKYILDIAVRECISNVNIDKYSYIYDKDKLTFTMEV
ncbi:MAG: hypothetical protein N4A50_06230 [Vallitalea sp.]|jgi:hypothetical protein|nr:hypothetical protein [Vallitalea sp.]